MRQFEIWNEYAEGSLTSAQR